MSELEAILHIEDDPLVTRAIDRELAQLGLRTVSVPTCAAARGLEDSYRLAIFDIDLADGDGVALAEELLGNGRVQRAVFHTGSRCAVALARAAKLGPVVSKEGPVAPLLDALGALKDDGAPASRVEGPLTPKLSTG